MVGILDGRVGRELTLHAAQRALQILGTLGDCGSRDWEWPSRRWNRVRWCLLLGVGLDRTNQQDAGGRRGDAEPAVSETLLPVARRVMAL